VQEIADFLQAKGVTVIFKPFGADELVETVEKALQGGQSAPSDADESAFLDRLERLAGNLPGGGGRHG
jgi:DNA-binding NarL/FixJ family response regulator